jgi:hypothetical protein
MEIERRQFIANLPSEACTIFHAGFGVVTGRSSDLQAWPINVIGISTGPSSRFQRKPVAFGCSILLTAAGQFRIRTGFPLRPRICVGHRNRTQDMVFSACRQRPVVGYERRRQ